MTKFQKLAAAVMLTALIVAIGAALYEGQQAREARAEAQELRLELAPLTQKIADMEAAFEPLSNQLQSLVTENSRLKNNSNDLELLKLRGEVTRLRPLQDDVATLQNMLKQSSAGLAQWKTNDLSDVGRATPIDAIQSYLYSSGTTNVANIKSSIVGDDIDPPTPEALQGFIKGEIDHPGMSEDMDITGYKILSQTWLGSDKARVELQMIAGGGVGMSGPFTLRKVDGEWKLVVFNVRGQDGKVSRLEFVTDSPGQ
jgi:hypothetical protein